MTRSQQKHYDLCLSQGTSPILAEMLALAQPPGCNTDNVFCADRKEEEQFKDRRVLGFRKKAEKQGVSTTGKIYLGGLARFPGDPTAWVSGRGDIAKTCETRGWGAEGTVNVKPDEEKSMEKSIDPIARKKLKEIRGK